MQSSSAYRFLPAGLAETVRGLNLTVRRPAQGPMTGAHRSPHHGASVEFAEYREYTPGDPVHLVDWAVYARTDRYVVRRFHEETNLRAFILLDTSASLGFRDEGALSKLDYALHLAAGLMFALVNQGDRAGLLTFDRELRARFEPVGTFEGLRPLLLHLETIRPEARGDIAAVIHSAAARLPPRSLVILISDLLQDSGGIVRGLRHLHHDGQNLLVMHVLDPGEVRLTLTGMADLRDLETGERMMVAVDDIRDAYQAAVEHHLEALRLGCMECLADYFLFDTRRPVEEAFHQLQRRVPVA